MAKPEKSEQVKIVWFSNEENIDEVLSNLINDDHYHIVAAGGGVGNGGGLKTEGFVVLQRTIVF